MAMPVLGFQPLVVASIRPEMAATASNQLKIVDISVSHRGGRLYGAYALLSDGSVGQTFIENPVIHNPYNLPSSSGNLGHPSGVELRALSSVCWADQRYGVYALGTDLNIHQNWWNGANLSGWRSIGKPNNAYLTAVTSVCWAPNQYGIYALTGDGQLVQKWWNGSQWSEWNAERKLNTAGSFDLTAVSWKTNNYGIYVLGQNGEIHEYWWDGSAWKGWNPIAAPPSQLMSIASVSWDTDRYAIYGAAINGNVYEYWWNGTKWSGWNNLGRPEASKIVKVNAASLAPGQIDIWAIDNFSSPVNLHWDGQSWSRWD